MVRPLKEFDMSKPDEIERWFEEMYSYLETEDFINQGTDKEGRIFVFKAFLSFRDMFIAGLPFIKAIKEKIEQPSHK